MQKHLEPRGVSLATDLPLLGPENIAGSSNEISLTFFKNLPILSVDAQILR